MGANKGIVSLRKGAGTKPQIGVGIPADPDAALLWHLGGCPEVHCRYFLQQRISSVAQMEHEAGHALKPITAVRMSRLTAKTGQQHRASRGSVTRAKASQDAGFDHSSHCDL